MVSRVFRAKAAAILAVAAVAVAGCSSSKNSGSTPNSGANSGGSSVPSKGTIKIATVGDFSGANSVLSVSLRDGIEAWSKDVNANGGVNGYKINLVEADVAADPAKAAATVKDLVENQKVVAFVGVDTPTTQESWADYATSAGIPIIGGNGATASWKTHPNMFSASPTLTVKYKVLSKAILTIGKPKLAIFYCSEIASCASAVPLFSAGGAAHVDGVQVVAGSAVSATAPDYTAQCLNAKSKGAQAVELSMVQAAAIRVVQACEQQGFKPTWILPGSVYGQATQTEAFDGAVVEDAFFLTSQNNAGVNRFKAAMTKYLPKEKLTGSTSAGWVSGLMFEKAAASFTGTPTSADIINAMNTIKDEKLGVLPNPLTFVAGQGHQTTNCQWVGTWNNGKKQLDPLADPICV